MMTVDNAITAIFKALKLVSTAPVFKHSRPVDVAESVYYVINSLPVGSGILQKVVVNVNAYCKDITPGTPDSKKLDEMSQLAITTIDNSQNANNDLFFYFQQQNILRGEELQSHYSNMRFDVRMLNS